VLIAVFSMDMSVADSIVVGLQGHEKSLMIFLPVAIQYQRVMDTLSQQ